MERRSSEKEIPVLFLLKCLLLSYIVTAALLLVLAFLLYRTGMGEALVTLAIIAVYVCSTFVGGFIAGKRLESRKFLWGLLIGFAYFLVLAVVSILVNQAVSELGNSVMTTFVLCGAGGMLGGMVS